MSDVLQTLIMIVSSIVLMVLVWCDFGGPLGLHAAMLERFGAGVLEWHPPLHHELLGAVGVIAWTLGCSVGYGGDLASESQRLLSCRDAREASKMYVWTQGILFFMLAILTLPALGAMVKWPGLHDGRINKELAFGMLLREYLPPGLLGLALVALMASIMSTVDSHMSYAGQVFINDVYQRVIRRSASPGHYLLVGRLAMCAVMGLSVIVATVAENVIDISLFMLGLTAAELTANWGQWWWWRFNGKARLAASIAGPFVFLFNQFVVFKYWIDAGPNAAYLVVLTSMGITCGLWVAVAGLTRPDPVETLVAFYRQARPPGWWGPVAAQAGGRPLGAGPIGRGLALAAAGMAAVAAGTIAFSSLYVARWGVAAGAGVVCVIAGAAFRAGYGRFLRSLDEER